MPPAEALLGSGVDIAAAVDRGAQGPVVTTADGCPVADVAAALARERQVTAELRDHNEHLRTALQTSRQIGTAIGIVMSGYKVTDRAAFDMICALSSRTNRKVRDIALDIVEQGHLDV